MLLESDEGRSPNHLILSLSETGLGVSAPDSH